MNQSTLLERIPPNPVPIRTQPRSRPWSMFALIVALVVVGFSSTMRPSAQGADTPLAEFSATRAQTHVGRIAAEPHPMGSPALRLVEAYIIEQLEGMGLDPEVQAVEVPDYFASPGRTTTVRNIIAVVPGTAPSKAIAVVAHYDTHPNTPGANDNGVGVAVLLEAARATLAGDRPANDILLLFTDGEEPNPRYGVTGFSTFHPTFGDIGLVVNLEAIGSSGPSLLVETSSPDTGIVDSYRSAARHPAAFSFLTETVDLFGGVGTDFDVFKRQAIPGLSFAYLRGSPIYHTDRDVPASVSPASVQHHGDNVMAAIEAFGVAELPPAKQSSDTVFFALTPFLTFGYSALVAGVLAVTAVGGLAVCVWRRLRSGEVSARVIGRGVLVLSVGSLAAGLVVSLVWWALTALRTSPSMWEGYVYLALLCVVASVVLSFVGGALAGRIGDAELATGIVVVWVVLGAVTTIVLPGFSYLFIWPALGGVVALAGRSSGRLSGRLWLVVRCASGGSRNPRAGRLLPDGAAPPRQPGLRSDCNGRRRRPARSVDRRADRALHLRGWEDSVARMNVQFMLMNQSEMPTPTNAKMIPIRRRRRRERAPTAHANTTPPAEKIATAAISTRMPSDGSPGLLNPA